MTIPTEMRFDAKTRMNFIRKPASLKQIVLITIPLQQLVAINEILANLQIVKRTQ